MKTRMLHVLCTGCILCLLLAGIARHAAAVLLTGRSYATQAVVEIEIIVDVREGWFISGEHRYALSEEQRPIVLRVEDDIVFAKISATHGQVDVALGKGNLAVTQDAAPYVSVEDSESDTTSLWEDSALCTVCGRPTVIGKHYLLDCGHFGCLMTVDHPTLCSACDNYTCNGQSHVACAHCGVALCVHIDLKCEYTRNPAPTPYATVEPVDGKTVFYYEDPAGRYIAGDPSLVSATRVPSNYGWAPGLDVVFEDPNAEED